MKEAAVMIRVIAFGRIKNIPVVLSIIPKKTGLREMLKSLW